MDRERGSFEDLVTSSFQELSRQLAAVLPDILAAILILAIGLLIAGVLGTAAQRLLKMTGIDALVQNTALGHRLNVVPQMRFSPSRFIGWLVKWFFILLTLIIASNVLGWGQINDFLNAVALYLPNVIIAVVVLVIGFIASNFVGSSVTVALEKSPLAPHEKNFLGSAARVAIIVFAVMAALIQLHIADDLIRVLFTGLIFAISLALGLAFGLGGREQAARFLARYADRQPRGDNPPPFDPMGQ
jgi:hypothetical protein